MLQYYDGLCTGPRPAFISLVYVAGIKWGNREMSKILIIEDDSDINGMLSEALKKSGYECVCAFSGTEGLLRIEQERFDLILLDMMLPGMNGSEVLSRSSGLTTAPFIVLSAVDDLTTKVAMLTDGAVDYITKPFQIEELRARILAHLRNRSEEEIDSCIHYKEISLDIKNHVISLDGTELQLTQQEYKILELLLRNRNKVFSKQEIYQYAWDDYYIGEDKTINVHISNIRQKLKKITEVEYIDTIWGIGFRMAK